MSIIVHFQQADKEQYVNKGIDYTQLQNSSPQAPKYSEDIVECVCYVVCSGHADGCDKMVIDRVFRDERLATNRAHHLTDMSNGKRIWYLLQTGLGL